MDKTGHLMAEKSKNNKDSEKVQVTPKKKKKKKKIKKERQGGKIKLTLSDLSFSPSSTLAGANFTKSLAPFSFINKIMHKSPSVQY